MFKKPRYSWVTIALGESLLFTPSLVATGQRPLWLQPPGRGILRGPGAWLGVTLRDLTPAEADRWQLDPGGAVIEDVVDFSPAWRASLRAGDVLTMFDGYSVQGAHHLSSLIRDTPPGRTIMATIARAGESWETDLTLVDEPTTSSNRRR
jgi:C-terminal processing protease CtpA/Prc